MRKPCELNLRLCSSYIVGINGYLAAFPVLKAMYQIDDMELRKIFLNSMPSGWSNQAYVQGFYCEYITLEKYVNMFNACKLRKNFMKVL